MVKLYSCKLLFIVAYVFFEVVADNLAYGHAFLRGDDFEFCVKFAVNFDGHLLDVVAAGGLVECTSYCFLLRCQGRLWSFL